MLAKHERPIARSIVVAFVAFAIPAAVLLGAALVLEVGLRASRSGLTEVVPAMTMHVIVRDYGPGASVSAAAFAVLVWSHGLDEVAVRRSRWSAVSVAALESFSTWVRSAPRCGSRFRISRALPGR